MKKWFLILLAVTLLIPTTALGQSAPTASAEQTRKPAARAVTISGHVSIDGKFLISDKDEIWTVGNPGIFAGQEGKQVLAKCQLHPEKNEIHVFFFKLGLQEAKYVATGDAAFRR